MSPDKRLSYLSSALLTAVLLSAFFWPLGMAKLACALLLLPMTALILIKVKRKTQISMYRREVAFLLSVIAVLYLMLFYLTGVHFKFYRSSFSFTPDSIFKTVLPVALIIIATEIIRSILVSQREVLVRGASYVCGVLTDLLILTNVRQLTSVNALMDLVAMALFPALMANLLYHYLSSKYGALPNIIYRLITTLYSYFLPIYPRCPDILTVLFRIFVPLLSLLFLRLLYERKQMTAKKKKAGKWTYVLLSLSVLVMISTAMLVSCQFRYGALVIATKSMTGELNKGDMVVYERYDDQQLKEGDIIVFIRGQSKIVHRIVRIDRSYGEPRYYTKGDANEDLDFGWIGDEDIFGVIKFKVAFVGYPTILLRDALASP